MLEAYECFHDIGSFVFRNNLTIIDVLVLEGQGGRGEMKLNNRKPGASTLQFDIAEKHLKNCDSKWNFDTMVKIQEMTRNWYN